MNKNTRGYWYNSIKLRLMSIMIVISIIPILFLGFYNIKIIKKEIQNSIHKQHILTASRVSYVVSDLVKTLQTSLETVSLTNSETFNDSSIKNKENLVYSILKKFPHLEEIVMVSANGKEIVKVSKRYAISREDLNIISDNTLFQKLKQGESFIGSPEIDIDNQIIFDLGVPVGGINEDFRGGFIVKISLRQVMQEISSVEVSDGGYIMLVDENGELIGHSDYSQVLRRQDVSESKGVSNLLKSKVNDEDYLRNLEFKSIIYESYNGEDVLGVYGLIPVVGWGVVVEQPLVNAYSTLDKMLFRLNSVLFIIIITITILGIIFIVHFIKPVEELAKGVASVKKGNLDYKIPKQCTDEIGLVIEAFNEMIEEIKKKRENENLAIKAEKKAAIGVLAAGVAHEINNPMNNLGFYADDLLERLETEDIEQLKKEGVFKEYLLNIREEIYRCTDITQSLLNYSREVEPQCKKVYIPNIIDRVMKLVKYPISKQNITINLKYEEPLPYIYVDESQLQQVILNLVTNSLDAMNSGGILTICLLSQGNSICMEVIDTGEGIEEGNLKHVFDPFFTTKPVGKGTGLGLAISQVIVERMGGTISLRNNQEIGTKATIWLPIVAEVIEDG